MNPEITKIIEHYLANELSPADKIAFEKKLAESTELQNEVIHQQSIHQAANRASSRIQIKQIAKSYHLFKKLITSGIIVAAVIAAVSLAYFTYQYTKSGERLSDSKEVKALIEKLSEDGPIDNLISEFFFWEGQDSVMLSKEGVLLSVPKGAFLLNGKPYNEKAIIQWQEAIDPSTIVKSGLSTMADDKLLETQGMFGFQAYTKEGKKLTVNPKVGVYVQAPVDQYKDGMQLFSGEKGKEGIINWTDPKPLQKIPVPVDMKELDFYPKGYENELNTLKMRKDKRYRDSLYLSFEDIIIEGGIPAYGTMQEAIEPINSNSNKKVQKENFTYKNESSIDKVTWKFNVRKIDENNAEIIARAEIASGWYLSPLIYDQKKSITPIIEFDGSLTKNYDEIYYLNGTLFDDQENKTKHNEDLGVEVYHTGSATFHQKVSIFSNKSFSIIARPVFLVCNDTYCLAPDDSKGYKIHFSGYKPNLENDAAMGHISPSKVMAFWQPAFNNTLLSTREFEKRMGSIHKTCDNKVLELYTSNLSKSMQEIDEMAVAMGHPEFAEYAKEQVGKLNPDSPHLKGLQSFYEREIKKMKKVVEANAKFKRKKEQRWDDEVEKERDKEQKRTVKRENKNLDEEYNFNLKNVYKQLGKTVGFQIHGGGTVFNIDKYVMDATVSRTTTVITDPETGKTAKITYHPFSFEVENAGNYEKVYAYLFPSQLNSYQRISGSNGQFDYPLNGDIQYDLAIIGISEKGYFYQEQKGLNKGNLGSVSLTGVTEKELNQKIKSLNESRGIIQPMIVADEMKWLIKEQQNYKEQKKRKEDAEFRGKIRQVIFPCSGEYLPVAVADSTSLEVLRGI